MNAINYGKLLEQYGGVGLDKQHSLAEIIGDNNWNIDVDKGTISFGHDLEFPMQILGTYSHSSETWLWAWANEGSNLPSELLQQADALKKYGEENNLDFLTTDQFKAEATDSHAIGIIASGMFNSSAYYCGDFGDGIIAVTIDSEKIDSFEFNEQLRILSVFPNLISIFIVDHQKALYNYLQAKGYSITKEENSIIAKKNEEIISAEFDEMGRLTKIDG